MKKKLTAKQLAIGGLIAGIYVAVSILFAAVSFGQVQVRFAEVLTLLPIFSPMAVWGVTVGCALTNIYGLSMGANIIGVYDVLFGTAATLLAALLTRYLRNVKVKGIPFLSAVPPVLINALVVGAELTVVMSPDFNFGVFALNFALVGLGQAIACFGLGLPLVDYLKKTGIADKIFTE